MPGPPSASTATSPPESRRELARRVMRYAAGSVVATVCSEVTFLLLYGPAHATPVVSSVFAWLAGAIPNYWLNRAWTWRRRGRPSFRRELLPYIAIVLGTLLLATLATTAADKILTGDQTSSGVRVALVGGTFLGVYAAVFLVRFFLFDRLFRSGSDAAPPSGSGPVSASGPI